MSSGISSVFSGAVAMASFAAMLFFLKFWRQTLDSFFLLFAVAFGIDTIARFVLGLGEISDEIEPVFYCTRLLTFGLIILAILQKNRRGKR
jgi:uncharacterized protein DUF5985